MSDRAQTKVCFAGQNGDGGWMMTMIMPGGKPLEKQLTLQNVHILQEQLAKAAFALAAETPEKIFSEIRF